MDKPMDKPMGDSMSLENLTAAIDEFVVIEIPELNGSISKDEGSWSKFTQMDLSDLEEKSIFEGDVSWPKLIQIPKQEPKDDGPTIQEVNEAIEEIMTLLPNKKLWPNETDFPELTRDMLNECGSDRSPSTKRPVWIIGNLMFFKRNSDMNNDRIVVGYLKEGLTNPSWDAFNSKDIMNMLELVKSKDPQTITNDEVKQLLSESVLIQMNSR